MAGQRDKNTVSRKRAFTALYIVLSIAVAGWAASPMTKLAKQEKEIKSLETKKSRVIAENRRLRQEIDGLKKDPEHWEELAREEMGYIHRDEEAYLVIRETTRVVEEKEATPTILKTIKDRLKEVTLVY